MIINAFSNRKFSITDQGRSLATINYPGWFSSCAQVTMGTSKVEIKRENFWGTKFSILRNGTRSVGMIKLCRKSKLQFLDPLNGEKTKSFQIKRKSWLSWDYEIVDEQQNVLASLKSKWNWGKFSNDLLLEYQDENLDPNLLTELLAYTAFVAHHHYRQGSMS